jgi:hypothetical protein
MACTWGYSPRSRILRPSSSVRGLGNVVGLDRGLLDVKDTAISLSHVVVAILGAALGGVVGFCLDASVF